MARLCVASCYLFVAALAMLAAWSRPARADGITGDLSIVVDGVAVRHSLDARPEDFVAPLPFLIADVRHDRFSLDAQALSTFGSLTFGDQATSLDVVTYSARYAVVGPVYAGIGVTSLNQTTAFDPITTPQAFTESTTERSHLYGTRFESGFVLPRMRFDLGFTPSIHGTVFDHCVAVYGRLATPCYTRGKNAFDTTTPEVASEFDADFRYFLPVAKKIDAIVGERYINFIGRVPATGGYETDQNRGSPIISLGLRYDFR